MGLCAVFSSYKADAAGAPLRRVVIEQLLRCSERMLAFWFYHQ